MSELFIVRNHESKAVLKLSDVIHGFGEGQLCILDVEDSGVLQVGGIAVIVLIWLCFAVQHSKSNDYNIESKY